MKPSRALSVSVIALALGVACSKPKPPTVRPLSARVVAVTPSEIRLAVDLEVTNPNGFPLVARSVDGTLSVGSGAELGRSHTDLASSIPAGATANVTSEVSVGFQNLGALAPFVLSPLPVPYELHGSATLGGEKLNVSVPFTLNGELTRAELVAIGLNHLAPR
ncbi:MAG TPA: LEA type 2 family protein [Polyangiaceae bacterium]|nr:LEA type 2 family protein [Polyangiaceae bacterium]